MADPRRVLVAGALGLSLLLSGCADDGGPEQEPTATDSPPSDSPEPSETSSEPAGGAASGSACDAIDVSALSTETGLDLTEPSAAGTPGEREACAITFADTAVLRVDVLPKHGSLEQDVEKAKALGTEVPQDVTVAGAPGLLVSVGDEVTHVGVVTHLGERLLMVTVNHQETGDELLEQMETLALATAEQVAGGAA